MKYFFSLLLVGLSLFGLSLKVNAYVWPDSAVTQVGAFDSELNDEIILSTGYEGEFIILQASVEGRSKGDPPVKWRMTCSGDNQNILIISPQIESITMANNYHYSRSELMQYPCETSDQYATLIKLSTSGADIYGSWQVTYMPVPTTTDMIIIADDPTRNIFFGFLLFFISFFGLLFYFRKGVK